MLIVPDVIYHHRASLQRAEKMSRSILSWLKMLKNLLLHLQCSLNCSRFIFIKSTLSISAKKALNRVSTISSFGVN